VHDPLNVGDLVDNERRQRNESGYDVSALDAWVAETSSSDSDRLEELYPDLIRTDTNSNGATAGSVAGTVLRAAAVPPRFTEPLHDRTRSAVFGYDNSRISELARRTMRLIDDGRMRTAA
jgi:hypothetical protein